MNVYKTTIDLVVRCLAVVILLVTVTGQGCPEPSHTCYDSDGFPIPCETKELKITPYMGANQVSGTLEEGAALVVWVENAKAPCVVYFDFGDKTPQVKEVATPLIFEENDTSQAATNHKYAKVGKYEAKITAVDRDGRSATTKIVVSITLEFVDDEECCRDVECIPIAMYTTVSPHGYDILCNHGECSCVDSQ